MIAGAGRYAAGWLLGLALAGGPVVGVGLAQETPAPQGQTPETPAATAAAPLPAAPTVAVRAGLHAAYDRLVFDWSGPVGYRVEQTGTRVTVRFDRPARLELDSARRVRSTRVANMAAAEVPDGVAVTFAVPDGATLRHFKSGTRVVVDVLQPAPAEARQAEAPATATTAATGTAAPAPDGASTAATGSAQPQPQPPSPVTPAAPTASDARRAAEGPPLWELRGGATPTPPLGNAESNATAQPVPAVVADAAPVPLTPPATDPPRTATPQPAAPQPAAPQPAAPQPAAPQPAIPQQGPAPQTAPVQAAAASAGATPAISPPIPPPTSGPVVPQPAEDIGDVTLAFDPGGPAAAAVFARAGWLYVIFDRAVGREAAPPPAVFAALSTPLETVRHAEGGGFRFALPPLLVPTTDRMGSIWTVRLARPPGTAGAPLTVSADANFALGARLVVEAPDAAKVIDFTDPVVGDRLKVVPLPVAGQRIAEERRMADAQLLETAQGIVVRPLAEDLLVRPVQTGLEVTAPGGLRLSPPEDLAAASPPPPPVVQSEPLFNYASWGHTRPDLVVLHGQRRWQRLLETPPDLRARGRLDLARFYLANGLGSEALGLLKRVEEDQPDLSQRGEFLAVRGAARVLRGDFAGALEDLNSPPLLATRGGEAADANLWRATAAAGVGDWERAHGLFEPQHQRIRDYPDPFFQRFALAAVEAALQMGDAQAASSLLDRLERRGHAEGSKAPAIAYLRGETLRLQGEAGKALESYETAIMSTDRLNRARAQFASIGLRLAEGRITPKRAAEEMERLRFAWRGDNLELAIQRRLGQVHLAAGNYRQAFDTMRRTISLFPDDPAAAEIAREMTDSFADIFLEEKGGAMSPLEALALYEEYRELTPPGAQGDAVIRNLAERLVEIDLLDRAATLLEYQVDYRLQDQEKARIGTRLAGIRLLDGKPAEAIRALDKSESAAAPPALLAERRILRARAQSQLDNSAEALRLLAEDTSEPANRLRVDIAFRSRQWAAAAQALGDVIGPPPPAGEALDPQKAGLVVRRAVALSLAQDTEGLDQLRQTFGPAMEGTREATNFQVLTRPGETTGLVDAASIQSRIAEIDLFRSFLDTYRGRQQAEVPPPPEAPAPPAVN